MNRFSNILFVASSDQNDEIAFQQAAKLALANQAKLTVVEMLGDFTHGFAMARDLSAALAEQRREQLQELVHSASIDGLDVEIKVLHGKPFIAIIQEVLEYKRDIVIKSVGDRPRVGIGLFGGTDMKLLRKCPCPVWLIKSARQVKDKEILVGLDYDPDNPENRELSLRIMDVAISLALAELCELHIVHAWRFEHESFLRSGRVQISDAEVDKLVKAEAKLRETWLSKIIEESLAAHGKETMEYLTPKLHVVKGLASDAVPTLAKELGAELIVMGTVARTGIPGYLMGNTAETILNRIDSSVLAIKPEGFVSPIQAKTP